MILNANYSVLFNFLYFHQWWWYENIWIYVHIRWKRINSYKHWNNYTKSRHNAIWSTVNTKFEANRCLTFHKKAIMYQHYRCIRKHIIALLSFLHKHKHKFTTEARQCRTGVLFHTAVVGTNIHLWWRWIQIQMRKESFIIITSTFEQYHRTNQVR